MKAGGGRTEQGGAVADGRPGILVGWKRQGGAHGIVVTLQIAADGDAYRRGEIERRVVVLGDRQIRSLARDLARAAEERGMELFARRPWWRFWR